MPLQKAKNDLLLIICTLGTKAPVASKLTVKKIAITFGFYPVS
jgi:hypothetical protein